MRLSKSLKLYFVATVFFIFSITGLITLSVITILSIFGLKFALLSTPVVFVAIFSLLLGTTIAAFMSKWLLSPITKLSEASKKVANGDFSVHITTSNQIHEIKETYDTFNNMVKELGSMETLRSDFISTVSHEFKTPISAIDGYVTLLQDDDLTNEERHEYVEKILYNTNRLSTLVGNILTLSKLENSTMALPRSTYRLDEQIRRCIVSLEPKWDAKSIDLDVDLDRVTYNGVEGLMPHVWSNLLDNAIKFSPRGGTITMRLTADDKYATFVIRDQGPGISGDEKKRIFEKFYQADSSHKSDGNGLGLALVKQITEVCGGEIFVDSQPDCGAAFTVRLTL